MLLFCHELYCHGVICLVYSKKKIWNNVKKNVSTFYSNWKKLFILNVTDNSKCFYCSSRKSSSWHASLRIRKKPEKKEKEVKKDSKLENGYRKSRDGMPSKVSVKVSFRSLRNPQLQKHDWWLSFDLQLLNPNYIYDGKSTFFCHFGKHHLKLELC